MKQSCGRKRVAHRVALLLYICNRNGIHCHSKLLINQCKTKNNTNRSPIEFRSVFGRNLTCRVRVKVAKKVHLLVNVVSGMLLGPLNQRNKPAHILSFSVFAAVAIRSVQWHKEMKSSRKQVAKSQTKETKRWPQKGHHHYHYHSRPFTQRQNWSEIFLI